MRGLAALATRLMPLAFVTMALLAVAQFWLQHGPNGNELGQSFTATTGFLRDHGWVVLALALTAWAFVTKAPQNSVQNRARINKMRRCFIFVFLRQ